MYYFNVHLENVNSQNLQIRLMMIHDTYKLASWSFAFSDLFIHSNICNSSRPEVFRKSVQQIYRRTPMPKCDFNKVAEATVLLKSHVGMGVLL